MDKKTIDAVIDTSISIGGVAISCYGIYELARAAYDLYMTPQIAQAVETAPVLIQGFTMYTMGVMGILYYWERVRDSSTQ